MFLIIKAENEKQVVEEAAKHGVTVEPDSVKLSKFMFQYYAHCTIGDRIDVLQNWFHEDDARKPGSPYPFGSLLHYSIQKDDPHRAELIKQLNGSTPKSTEA